MNKKLRQLLAAKAAAVDAATAIANSVADGAMMTTEQAAAFDAHMATATSLEADIFRTESLNALQRTAPAAISVGVDHASEKCAVAR